MATEKRRFKTKKVLSGVRSEYHAWDDWNEGDVIVCKLVGTAKNKWNAEKNNWIVEILEASFSDKAVAKKLKPGTTLTLNSSGQLDKGLEQVEMGSLVQVTYNGKHAMKGGKYAGKDAHTMEVVEIEEEGDEDEDEEEEEEEEDSEEESDDEEEEEDEDSEDDL